MKDGVAKAHIPARMEVLSRAPLVILDGAHNPGAAQVLAQALKKYLPNRKIVGMMGMLKDKDSKSSLRSLATLFQALITVTPKNPRALLERNWRTAPRNTAPRCLRRTACPKPLPWPKSWRGAAALS